MSINCILIILLSVLLLLIYCSSYITYRCTGNDLALSGIKWYKYLPNYFRSKKREQERQRQIIDDWNNVKMTQSEFIKKYVLDMKKIKDNETIN